MAVRRIGRDHRLPTDGGAVLTLACGRDFFNVFADPDEMRRAWPHVRDAAVVRARQRYGPEARPWGFFQFDLRGRSQAAKDAAWIAEQKRNYEFVSASQPKPIEE